MAETAPSPAPSQTSETKESPRPAEPKDSSRPSEGSNDSPRTAEEPKDSPRPSDDSKESPRPADEAKAPDTPRSEDQKDGVKSPEPEANGESPGTPKNPTLREQFKAFSKFGDSKSDGKQLTLSQSDKWMKQAKVIDGKTITTTDTAITFKKFKQMKIAYPDYEKYLAELAKYKNQDLEAIKDKLKNCGTPGLRGTTSVVKNSAVDRLTNTQKYTGSHKQRFDADGKGKGVAGRKDIADKSGYVAGYKNKDSYAKTH
ncbi:hypothetical protein HAZT_HAZT009478 [Hyalella azteca]|uniref:Tubulin polymerization-promoting protein homolog n=1 Tax=Hyalella azteca TaxID=294128 RepID=A0A6A0H6D3_HYAAZ|nr:tubulin polymerization-promoting protein homolog isoform X1 [Hyalella azteca]KAA0201262.1 hypothetical protein HAZT_HAZT009478 [Hyalella azteca]